MKRCICIDWLQLHVAMPFRDYDTLVKPKKYVIVKLEGQTRNFKALYTILDTVTSEEVAVIAAEPRNEMCMQSNSGLLKINNKYLYQRYLWRFVQELLHDLQCTFINITRIDIAYDFLRFDTMSCPDFINRFASRYYMKAQSCKFKMMGDSWSVDHGEITGGISSLKFGLETSDVNYYLYNKTLELQQVKDKPWIKEHWRSHGWDDKAHVYRLEFSLKPDTKGIAVVDKEGEIKRVFHFKDLDMLRNIHVIYEHLFNRHFCFVKTEKTKKGFYKKQSRCKEIVLFKNYTFEAVRITLSDKKDSGRAAKVFAKSLMKLNQELRGTDFDLAIYGNEVMTWIIKTRDLEAWAAKKFPNINYSDRVVTMLERSRANRLALELGKINALPDIYPSQIDQERALLATEQAVRINNLPSF